MNPGNPHPSPDKSTEKEESIEKALAEFSLAWCSDERLDPELFCKAHAGCGPELRERINDFLFVAEGINHEAATPGGPAPGASGLDLGAGRVLGEFEIIKEIGRGGMGVVYEAKQLSLHRRVALKVLPPHLSWSDEAVLKFRREAEAGSRQNHPGLVAVHAVGQHEGIHFIAQELVEGGLSLADRIAELRKTNKRPNGYYHSVAKLTSKIAQALHHAHTAGVIHRDIKPSNILIDPNGLPKVSDFGLARVEDALALSRSGHLAGTPYYMSPEQAESRRSGIDHRTDIYSLGVTLYEMLTHTIPFEGNTSQEVLKKILTAEPRNPRQVKPDVPRDLSVICLKAMEKRPEHRYATMGDFADDLMRFIEGRPIMAQPTGAITRVFKRIRRNPAFSAAAGSAAFAILALLIIGPILYVQSVEDKNKLEDSLVERKGQERISLSSRAKEKALENPGLGILLGLEGMKVPTTKDGRLYFNPIAIEGLLDALLACHEIKTLGASLARHCAMSPDNQGVVMANEDGSPRVLDIESGKERFRLEGHIAAINTVAYSLDGSRIVTASDDWTVRLWDAAKGTLIATFEHDDKVRSAVCNQEGTRILSASDDMTAWLWDIKTHKMAQRFIGHAFPVLSAFFHPEENRIITASADGTVRIWDIATGEEIASYDHKCPVKYAAFNKDGRILMSLTSEGTLRIWDAAARKVCYIHPEKFRSAAFCRPDSLLEDLLITTSLQDNIVKIWNLDYVVDITGFSSWQMTEVMELKGHENNVISAEFSPDRSKAVSISKDMTARVWHANPDHMLPPSKPYDDPNPGGNYNGNGSCSKDGTRALTVDPDTFTATVWDTADDERILRHTFEDHAPTDTFRFARLSPKGDLLAGATSHGQDRVHVIRVSDGQLLIDKYEHQDGDVNDIDFSTDGRYMVVSCGEAGSFLYNTGESDCLHILYEDEGVSRASFNYPEDDMIVTCSTKGRIRRWNAKTGKQIGETLNIDQERYQQFYFSPDGLKLVTEIEKNQYRIWDLKSGKLLSYNQADSCSLVLFNPQNRKMALFQHDGNGFIRDYDFDGIDEPEKNPPLESLSSDVDEAGFSPDGKNLVAISKSGILYHWEVSTGKLISGKTFPNKIKSFLRITRDNRWALIELEGRAQPEIWPLIDLADYANNIKPRELTVNEKIEYFLLTPEEEALNKRIDLLFNQRKKGAEIRDQIYREEPIPIDLHPFAEGLINLHEEDPFELNRKAWKFLVSLRENKKESYKEPLEEAERACALSPGNGTYEQTLGVAQYRYDHYEEALTSLTPFINNFSPDTDGGFLTPLVFCTMASCKLGNKHEADEYLNRLREKIQEDPRIGRLASYAAFLEEAESLISDNVALKNHDKSTGIIGPDLCR
ncbi:MAG: protein kinase [Planctomycetota bacterium]